MAILREWLVAIFRKKIGFLFSKCLLITRPTYINLMNLTTSLLIVSKKFWNNDFKVKRLNKLKKNISIFME
jgi:hypothetical protein